MKSPSLCVKLNTDGNCYGNPGPVGLGGLFRNDQGGWIMGYAFKVLEADSIEAKMCSIRFGLQTPWDARILDMWVKSDYEVAVKLILQGDPHFHPLGLLIMDCRSLMARPWKCRLTHILREGNSCADFLANLGHNNSGSALLAHPPMGLGPLLLKDLEGLPVIRL
ncbi:hypothetical protein L1049_010865 [Liquidambar formosana]|uniref:RNase H type-1 domain-containing protein n=1 Tax=Liquidambar formosana TaxID=63359 RepID=A0AAP0RVU5_LIQFO